VQGDWMVDLILDGVDKGEVKIIANPTSIDPKVTSHADEALIRKGDVTRFFGDIKDGLNKLSMDSIVTALTSLTGSWDFCIPGGQDFYIDKAMFNAEQDLLCQLVYKTKA